MARKSDSTRTSTASKPGVTNTPKRTYATRQAIIAAGVPASMADDFPLFIHGGNKAWSKKIRGKNYYFGKLSDGYQAALDAWNEQKADLLAGRTPRAKNNDGLRLEDLCNHFLHEKRGLITEGTLTLHSWYDYHRTCKELTDALGPNCPVDGLVPEDFSKVRDAFRKHGWSPVKFGNEINRVHCVLKWGVKHRWVIVPPDYGTFVRASRATLRKHRATQQAEHGKRRFSAEEIRTIIEKAPQPMRSMVLLGINSGLSNMDVASLTFGHMDLVTGWLDYPRAKTGIPRRIPLWPETVASIREWLKVRPKAKHAEDDQLVFLTRMRRAWHRRGRFVEVDGKEIVKGVDNPVAKSFKVLLDNLGIGGRRNFLALRHTFRTEARAARDREAVDSLMGHVDNSMAAHYIEDGLPDDRLQGVVNVIHAWLWQG